MPKDTAAGKDGQNLLLYVRRLPFTRLAMTQPLLSIVIPTFNEHDSIVPLLDRIERALQPLAGAYEILVVDDASPDGTAALVAQQATQRPGLVLLARPGPRDLSQALAHGFNRARGEWLAAMDADGQHDPAALLPMLDAARQADLVVATRYASGGHVAGWSPWRTRLSRLATRCVQGLLRTACSDPLSGFFLLHRPAWLELAGQLQPSGFKLLLAILARAPGLRLAETGYTFQPRQHGHSKFGPLATWHFLCTLWRAMAQGRP